MEPWLLLITDRSVQPQLEKGVAAALRGGITHLLLREKNGADAALADLAVRLGRQSKSAGARFLLHGRIDLAMAVGADGVHLPGSAPATAAVRRRVGPEKIVGRSCHGLEAAHQAFAEGADYITLSPLFPTLSHPAATPLGVEQFSRICGSVRGRVLALGGIHAANVRLAMGTGAHGVALIRGILDRPDPTGEAVKIWEQLQWQCG